MIQVKLHIVWLFIFNSALIILSPFIEGPVHNYLSFTLIFLGTNILTLSFLWQAIKDEKFEITLSPLQAASFLFLGAILFSYLFTISPPSTRYGFFTMASVVINGAFLSFIIPKERLWKWLCLALTTTVTALSLYGLYQYIGGYGDWGGRAHAVFVTPNSFSGYLLLTMPVLTGLYLASEKYAAGFFLLNIISFAALLATGTGGRWILLAAAVFVVLVLFRIFAPKDTESEVRSQKSEDKKSQNLCQTRVKILSLGFLAVLLIFFIPSGNRSNVSLTPKPAELSGSTQDRLNIWESTWQVIKEHPLRGVGFWSFHTIYSKYKNQIYKDVEHYFSHNDYLQLWAELGLIGVAVFLLLIFIYFREGLRCLKVGAGFKPAPTDRIMLLSTMIGSFLVLIHTIGDFDLYIPAILFIFWGYMAYAASMARELGLCKAVTIDLNQFRIFTLLGKKKLYIITAGIIAFASFWVSDPYLAGLHNERGRIYLGKGEYEKAVKFFNKAVELDPIDDSYHFNLGMALAKYSSDPATLKKAEDEMKKAMSLSPYRSDIYFNTAIFYRSFYLKEKGDAAIAMLKKARELDPVDITITYNLGALYLELGRYKDAITEIKKYLAEKPDDIDARIALSGAYKMNKQFENAIKEIDRLIDKNSNNNYAHFLKANILADIRRYDEAYGEYRLASREKGREADVWYAIGILFLKQDKPKEARDAFQKTIAYKNQKAS